MTNHYYTTVSFEHNYAATDPLTATRNSNKFWRFNDLRRMIKNMLSGGMIPGTLARVGTAAASGTITLSSTGAAANDTITLNGAAITAKQLRATGTVTAASVSDGDTVTVGASTYTYRTSPSLAGEIAIGAGNTASAANLATAINADTAQSGIVTATSASAVCTIRAVNIGTAGNSIVLTSSNGTRLAVTGSGTLTNGAANAGDQFDITGTLAQQTQAVTDAFNNSTTALLQNMVLATNDGAAIITLTALRKGLGGNAMTLAKSGTNIAVSGTRLTGGTDTVYNF